MNVMFTSVKYGKNKNHLIFRGEVPYLSNVRDFEFDYIGTEVTMNGNMTQKQLEDLEQQMHKDFGYAPFDLKAAKKALGNFKNYKVKQ